jgi:hypothetical protein
VTRLTGSGNGAAVEPPGTDEPSTERTSTPGELSVLLLPPCHYGFPQRYERCVVRCSDTRTGSWALTELLLVVEPGVLWCSVWQLLSTLRCLSVCVSVCLCVCARRCLAWSLRAVLRIPCYEAGLFSTVRSTRT